MTRAIMAKRSIARGRVYLAGIAGGLMASIDAAAYPDLYAAVAVMSSSAYSDWTCFTTGLGIPVQTSAQLAFEEMGPRALVVPTFVLGGMPIWRFRGPVPRRRSSRACGPPTSLSTDRRSVRSRSNPRGFAVGRSRADMPTP